MWNKEDQGQGNTGEVKTRVRCAESKQMKKETRDLVKLPRSYSDVVRGTRCGEASKYPKGFGLRKARNRQFVRRTQ